MAHELNHKQFTAKEVHELLGIDKNKLFHWINTHRLLRPDIDEGSGRGKKRIFSRNNLLELAVIADMLLYGIELGAIKKFMDFLEKSTVPAINKDGKWIKKEGKAGKKGRRFDLYDFAFEGGQEVALKISHFKDAKVLEMKFWVDRPETLEDKLDTIWPVSYIMINITTIAKVIEMDITKL